MLLFMVEADFDQGSYASPHVLARRLEEFHHGRIDMPAIGGDLLGAGTGDMAALMAGVAGAGADIIGVVQKRLGRVEWHVSRTKLAVHKLLGEPRGGSAVPFSGAFVPPPTGELNL